MGNRQKMPPNNEVNALVSFGNMMCYTACLDTIYHTQLNPTISFLHEPGARRYSLALDLAEIFKPLLVDRTIFAILNKKILQKSDFDTSLNRCVLKDSGRKAFVKAFDEKLKETIKHRTLNKHVSYKSLIKLECYKLQNHILGMEEYKPFKAWW
jgi:CRISPR-associated protein Cas1